MIDLAATFEEHATEAAAMVWRVKRTPVALRDVVALATSKAQGIVLTEPEFLPMALIDGLRGLAGVIPKPHDDELATADVGITEAFAAVASTGSICVSLGRPLVAASCLLMPLNIILLAERAHRRTPPRSLQSRHVRWRKPQAKSWFSSRARARLPTWGRSLSVCTVRIAF